MPQKYKKVLYSDKVSYYFLLGKVGIVFDKAILKNDPWRINGRAISFKVGFDKGAYLIAGKYKVSIYWNPNNKK